jgi:RNA polymerase sigma factor (sigma-70 family)
VTSDLELLAAWRSGDEVAGDTLVRRHFPIIYRFFANKVGRGIEDLVQRTFLKCVESRERIPDEGFRAYLLGISKHQLFHHFRREQRHGDRVELGEFTVDGLNQSPSGMMAGREQQRLLLRALRRIPLDFQMTLELFYWEELGINEIAAALEVAPGTVKSRLSRARELLRAQLEAIAASPELAESTVGELENWARSLRDLVGQPKI